MNLPFDAYRYPRGSKQFPRRLSLDRNVAFGVDRCGRSGGGSQARHLGCDYLAAAGNAGCRLLLSEDTQQGFTWNGVTVVNPFSVRRHELLEGLLEE